MPLFRLTDGTPVAVRPIQPHDKPMFERSRGLFSAATMHKRFLSAKPNLTRAELRYLTEVDGRDHVAFLAVPADDPTRFVGVARLVRLHDDPATAEAAIVVADHLQGKGLGKRLALIIADAARERGIERILGAMLSDNPAAHRLMQTIGARLEDHGHSYGVHELVADLAA